MKLIVGWGGYKCFDGSLCPDRMFAAFENFHRGGHVDNSNIYIVHRPSEVTRGCSKEVTRIRV